MKIRIRIAWWLTPYTYALVMFAVISGRVPDRAKFERVARKAIRISLE